MVLAYVYCLFYLLWTCKMWDMPKSYVATTYFTAYFTFAEGLLTHIQWFYIHCGLLCVRFSLQFRVCGSEVLDTIQNSIHNLMNHEKAEMPVDCWNTLGGILTIHNSMLTNCKHAKTVHHKCSYTKRQNNQQLYCWPLDSIYADYGNSGKQVYINYILYILFINSKYDYLYHTFPGKPVGISNTLSM